MGKAPSRDVQPHAVSSRQLAWLFVLASIDVDLPFPSFASWRDKLRLPSFATPSSIRCCEPSAFWSTAFLRPPSETVETVSAFFLPLCSRLRTILSASLKLLWFGLKVSREDESGFRLVGRPDLSRAILVSSKTSRRKQNVQCRKCVPHWTFACAPGSVGWPAFRQLLVGLLGCFSCPYGMFCRNPVGVSFTAGGFAAFASNSPHQSSTSTVGHVVKVPASGSSKTNMTGTCARHWPCLGRPSCQNLHLSHRGSLMLSPWFSGCPS